MTGSKEEAYAKVNRWFKVVGKIAKWLIYVGVAVLAILYLFGENILGEDSSLSNFFLDQEKFLVFFDSFAKTFLTTGIAIIVILIVKKVLLKMNNSVIGFNRKNITIKKLVDNIISVISALVIVVVVLEACGVDVGVLIASAGALSLVIGLGLQSLVKDVVSGTFIILEKSFEVGDIVIINGFKGKVEEVGLRTTKIVNPAGDRFTISNSSINEIINNSHELSLATCKCGVEYGDDLKHIEEVINSNISRISKTINGVSGEIMYKGVSALLDSSVELLFVAKCREEDVPQVSRDMNRAIKLLFDENGINIPFPQLVVTENK